MSDTELTNLAWCPIELRAGSIDEDARTAEFVASTEAIDSYDEVVEQDWILDRYKRNPVVLYAHNQPTGGGMLGGSALRQRETFPIGRAQSVKVVGNKKDGTKRLEAKIEFVPEGTFEEADIAWKLVKSGFLRAVSVGFMPHDARKERRGDREVFVLSRNELFEISVVPLPANPEAVALMPGSRGERRALLERLAARNTTAAQSGQENTMDTTQLQAELDAAKAHQEKAAADVAAAKDVAEKAVAEAKALSEKLAALEAEKTAEKAKAAELAAELNKREVEALRGLKLYPAEVEPMTRLRAQSPELFTELMAARPDITLTRDAGLGGDAPTNSVVETDGTDPLATIVRDAGKDD
jgi:HK97 family phage prohead protease